MHSSSVAKTRMAQREAMQQLEEQLKELRAQNMALEEDKKTFDGRRLAREVSQREEVGKAYEVV